MAVYQYAILILFGLGVDYSIHFYARYLEERTLGYHVKESIDRTFTQTGPAIMVSAMTTAAALFVLVLADFQGFSQFDQRCARSGPQNFPSS